MLILQSITYGEARHNYRYPQSHSRPSHCFQLGTEGVIRDDCH